ncbi:hypothetical protein [Avibacterium paragallinarum]|uniref:Uncharacterized protein n=1 Tax=Avibacterium paragallinarum TaxID=728 RepID=A0A380X3C4_AVIPA|nr:hypothetical protein [Avibacterium paragallinarum]KAA6209014.1 hypothetical protein F1968_06160 [Avibacterium paragallinarum]RZN51768.1 hypothetical protein EIG78_12790 [Avibacterium paragallinarum]RZN71706.1 hypothetical protein EIG77_06775 [Avibacterium paragallinarum]SUU97755.1 Uncharacterised protein [Avibacterium paragallinarum]SUU98634.1 Uncharacterised protein [Avibacterium paragallinarum]
MSMFDDPRRDYRLYYPEFLSRSEKEQIKSAMLESLRKSSNVHADLFHYLEAVKVLNEYPEPPENN